MLGLGDISETPVERPSCSACDVKTFVMLQHELQQEKFRSDTEVTQATATTLCMVLENNLMQCWAIFYSTRAIWKPQILHALQTSYFFNENLFYIKQQGVKITTNYYCNESPIL
jgi:hypothetical protein